jgi:hypothetical protein
LGTFKGWGWSFSRDDGDGNLNILEDVMLFLLLTVKITKNFPRSLLFVKLKIKNVITRDLFSSDKKTNQKFLIPKETEFFCRTTLTLTLARAQTLTIDLKIDYET